MTSLDLVAVCLALVVSMTLTITTAIANARLTRQINRLRADRILSVARAQSIKDDCIGG